MAEFKVYESPGFLSDMEDALSWLYENNLEQSEEFADKKFLELQNEIDALKIHLRQTPYIGQADPISGIRRFPIYSGRYLATWVIDEKIHTVHLHEFLDAKYPKELRYGKKIKLEEE